jgi:hypothetical protein
LDGVKRVPSRKFITLVGTSANLAQALARGFLVLAAHLRMLLKVRLAVPAHEREIQRPPGQAHHRHPDQLLLQEELEQRDLVVQQMLQHQDVDPGLVVAVDHVPAARVQAVDPLYVPVRVLCQRHPAAVAADPGLGDPQQHRSQRLLHGCERQQQLDQREDQQHRAPRTAR